MAHTPPPVVPKVQPEPNQPQKPADTAAETPQTSAVDYERMIRSAMVTISASVVPAMRQHVDRYMTQIRAGTSDNFPQTVSYSAVNQERSSKSKFGDVVCFYIGSTLEAFREWRVNPSVTVGLDKRLQVLQATADALAAGKQPKVLGSDSQGFVLELPGGVPQRTKV